MSDDASTVIKTISNDQRLESYRSFFDFAWAKEVMDLTEGSEFENIVFDLCAVWRGVANTFVFPWLMLNSFKAFAEGLARRHDPHETKLIRAIRERIVHEMGGDLNRMKQQKLQRVLSSIDKQVREKIDQEPFEVDAQSFWDELLELSEWKWALWGSQRLCYGALYYAYEDFLIRCLKRRLKKQKYRMKYGEEAERDFSFAFNPAAHDHCWSEPRINVAREIRNALVHNGARVTGILQNLKHDIPVVEGELHIMAPHTRELHDLLKSRVNFLVRALVAPTSKPVP